MIDPDRIIAEYRSGGLTAEAAARELLPLLRQAGTLELPLTESDLPLLQALQRLTQPPLPAAAPLVWESKVWQGLARMPEILWPQITTHRLDQAPQCLNYVFLVGSDAAAEALVGQIEEHTDHRVTVQLPEDYTAYSGRVFGQLPPRRVTRDDLVAWAAWLQSLTPVPDAALEKLHLSPPRADPS